MFPTSCALCLTCDTLINIMCQWLTGLKSLTTMQSHRSQCKHGRRSSPKVLPLSIYVWVAYSITKAKQNCCTYKPHCSLVSGETVFWNIHCKPPEKVCLTNKRPLWFCCKTASTTVWSWIIYSCLMNLSSGKCDGQRALLCLLVFTNTSGVMLVYLLFTLH